MDEWRIREMRQQKGYLEKLPINKKRLEGGGRKVALPTMEELGEWIEGSRAKNLRITRASVQRQAAEIAKTQGSGDHNYK